MDSTRSSGGLQKSVILGELRFFYSSIYQSRSQQPPSQCKIIVPWLLFTRTNVGPNLTSIAYIFQARIKTRTVIVISVGG